VDPARRPAASGIRSSFYPAASAPRPGTDVSYQWYADSTPACTAAYLYAVADALDEAYDLANRCLPAPIGLGLSVGDLWAPETAAFRRDPRFAGYVERLGLHLIEYWQKYGPPDDCELKNGKLACH
jgi:hypothetical protein